MYRKYPDLDHQLVSDFQNGSTDAMEKIVERYEKKIFTFGLRLCGHLQDAEDVMQETFLNAFRYLPRFRGETKLKNWLYKIASTACIRKRRRGKFAPEREISLDSLSPGDGKEGGYEIPDWSSLPEDGILRSELKKLIEHAVQSLHPDYRIVFNLREVEEFSTEETARILGITEQAVKTRLHRARLYLRKLISNSYNDARERAQGI